jgi:hypothetical protein
MQDAAISAVDGPDALSVELLTTVADFDGLAGAWQTLECQVTSPAFFQSFAWCRFVAHARQATESGDAFQPRVIVVRSEGEVALIWPLAIVKSAAGRVVEDLTEPFGQYSDALVAPRANADALLDAAWAEIKRWRVDALMLQRVRSDAGIASWLGRNAHRVGQTREAPFVALSAFEDFAAYHRSIRAKTRKNLRNYRNRLARDGEVTHRVITDPDDIRDLTELCLLWRTDWLTASGLSSAAFQHCAFERIIDGLAKGTHGAPPLQMMTLTLNQKNAPPDQADGDSADASHAPRIVAIQWGFRFRNRYYAFMSRKEPGLRCLQPWPAASRRCHRGVRAGRHRHGRPAGAAHALQGYVGDRRGRCQRIWSGDLTQRHVDRGCLAQVTAPEAQMGGDETSNAAPSGPFRGNVSSPRRHRSRVPADARLTAVQPPSAYSGLYSPVAGSRFNAPRSRGSRRTSSAFGRARSEVRRFATL